MLLLKAQLSHVMIVYLEAARVSKHPPGPVDEFVQAAQISDQIRAWSLLQMVGVSQDDVAIQIYELLTSQSLHCSCIKQVAYVHASGSL